MKLWIPGGNGLLGSTLAKESLIPCLATSRQEVNIADLHQINVFLDLHPTITHIVNCAAYSLVDASETEREAAFHANARGPENLAHIALAKGIHLTHISTDYVFPGDLTRPLTESDPIGPCNHYGLTKLEGELRVLRTHPQAAVVRVSWLFGDGGKNFVSKLLEMLLSREEILLTDDQWGRPTYAPDLSRALLKILDSKGLYHYANHGVASKYTFGLAMKEMAERLGFPVVTKKILPVAGSHFPSPCKRPAYTAFDTTKIEKHLHLSIRPWEEALKEYLTCAR